MRSSSVENAFDLQTNCLMFEISYSTFIVCVCEGIPYTTIACIPKKKKHTFIH